MAGTNTANELAGGSSLALTAALRECITQLDSLIRGRRGDLSALKKLGLELLHRTLDNTELARAPDKDVLVAQGDKIQRMLRSPRFTQHYSNPAFILMRAVAVRATSCNGYASTTMLMALVKLHANAVMDLGRSTETRNEATRMVEVLEELYDSSTTAALLPKERAECNLLVADSLMLKADLLARKGDHKSAIAVLTQQKTRDMLKQHPNHHIMLASKAFMFGQTMITREERNERDEIDKAAAATACYKECLDILDREMSREGKECSTESRDASLLRSKCLVQYAYALFVVGHFDTALLCLQRVDNKELREDTLELRFNILSKAISLSSSSTSPTPSTTESSAIASLHACIAEVLQDAKNDRSGSFRNINNACALRLLRWLRRAGIVTQFDDNTVSAYNQLMSIWQDDERNIEVKLQLAFGALIHAGEYRDVEEVSGENQKDDEKKCETVLAASADESRSDIREAEIKNSTNALTSSSRSREKAYAAIRIGLRVCDGLLKDHVARQRSLQESHFERMAALLTHSLNREYTARQWGSSVEISRRLLQTLELSNPGPKATSAAFASINSADARFLQSEALAVQAHCLLALSKFVEAEKSADDAIVRANGRNMDAFVIKFRCIVRCSDISGRTPKLTMSAIGRPAPEEVPGIFASGCKAIRGLKKQVVSTSGKYDKTVGDDGDGITGAETTSAPSNFEASFEVSHAQVLDALNESIMVLVWTQKSLRDYGSITAIQEMPGFSPPPEPFSKCLRDLELECTAAYVAVFSGAPYSPSHDTVGHVFSLAGFIMRSYELLGSVLPQLKEQENTHDTVNTFKQPAIQTQASTGVTALQGSPVFTKSANKSAEEVDLDIADKQQLMTSTETLITGCRFLLRQLCANSTDDLLYEKNDSGSESNSGNLGSTEEIEHLSFMCWNIALYLRQQGLDNHPIELSQEDSPRSTNTRQDNKAPLSKTAEILQFPCSTNLFLLAFDLQDITAADKHRIKIRMLTMAASDVIKRALSRDSEVHSDQVNGSEKRIRDEKVVKAHLFSALQWIQKASALASQQNMSNSKEEVQTAKDINMMQIDEHSTGSAKAAMLQASKKRKTEQCSSHDDNGLQSVGETASNEELMTMKSTLALLKLMLGLSSYFNRNDGEELVNLMRKHHLTTNDPTLASMPISTTMEKMTTPMSINEQEQAQTQNSKDEYICEAEKVLLETVDMARTDLSSINTDSLSAIAASAKSKGYSTLAHNLLRIAINQRVSQLKYRSLSSEEEKAAMGDADITLSSIMSGVKQDESAGETEKEQEEEATDTRIILLYRDLFFVAPTIEASLNVVEELLTFLPKTPKPKRIPVKLSKPDNTTATSVALESPELSSEMSSAIAASTVPPTPPPSMVDEALANVAGTCYNWGLQSMRLGHPTSGVESERLIGKAMSFVPHCEVLLRPHENNMAMAYQRALEIKERQHEIMVATTLKYSSP